MQSTIPRLGDMPKDLVSAGWGIACDAYVALSPLLTLQQMLAHSPGQLRVRQRV